MKSKGLWLLAQWAFWSGTYAGAFFGLMFCGLSWFWALIIIGSFPRILEWHIALGDWLQRKFKPQELSDIFIGENPHIRIQHPE